MEVRLDGRYLEEPDAAHVYLAEKLDLPEYYGGNLDALYDCLTETMTFFSIDIACVPAVRTVVMQFQIILRISCGCQDLLFLTGQLLDVDTQSTG